MKLVKVAELVSRYERAYPHSDDCNLLVEQFTEITVYAYMNMFFF